MHAEALNERGIFIIIFMEFQDYVDFIREIVQVRVVFFIFIRVFRLFRFGIIFNNGFLRSCRFGFSLRLSGIRIHLRCDEDFLHGFFDYRRRQIGIIEK